MALSADQRYYLKRKALYYYYEKNCSNTDIAKMLGISRVTTTIPGLTDDARNLTVC